MAPATNALIQLSFLLFGLGKRLSLELKWRVYWLAIGSQVIIILYNREKKELNDWPKDGWDQYNQYKLAFTSLYGVMTAY